MYRKMKKLATYIPILLFPLTLFAPALLQGKVLFWGTPALQFIPWHWLAVQEMQQGILPLWNPFNGMGAPLAANYQSALFYPPNWPALMAGWFGGAGWLAWAHTLMIAIHLGWMGIGMYRLIARLGYHVTNRVLAGLAMALCGYFVARAGFFSMIWAGAWIPWVLAAATEITYPGKRAIRLGQNVINLEFVAVISLQLLAGHAQLTWYTWIFLAAWLGSGAWGADKLRGLWVVIRSLFPSFFLALALAAVQLFLTSEYLLLSQRSATVDYESAITYSLWPWRLSGFFLPDLFGNPGLGTYWGYGNFWEDAVYIGIFPIILALLTLPQVWRRRDRESSRPDQQMLVRFLWVFILVSVLLALGKNTPFFPFLFRHIPTFSMFNSPSRYLIWAEISLVILAALGLNSIRTPRGKGLYWLRLATAGGFAITLGAFLAIILLEGVQITFIRATAICGVFTLISGFLVLSHSFFQQSSRLRTAWNIFAVVTIGIDLMIANWHLIPAIGMDFYNPDRRATQSENISDSRVYLPPGDEHFIKFKRFLQFDSYNIDEDWENLHSTLIPNINILSDIAMANNFDPMVTSNFDRWMNYLARLPESDREKWYQLMNVSFVERRQRDESYSIHLEPVLGSQRFWIYECFAIVNSDEEAWNLVKQKMATHYQSAEDRVLVIQDDQNNRSGCFETANIAIDVLHDEADHLKINVVSHGSAWLFISNTWYPGWQVKIEGIPATLYQANTLFQAIPINAGEYVVEFRYIPVFFWVGLGISFLSFVFILTACVIRKAKTLPDCQSEKSLISA